VQAEALLSLAATVAGEHHTQDVLDAMVRGLARHPGVALARIWLLLPGDLCDDCFLRSECIDRKRCLHLVASAVASLNSAGEDGSSLSLSQWSSQQDHFRRLPLNYGKIAAIATGEAILIKDFAAKNEGIAQSDWAEREQIRSFAGCPLVSRGNILGVLAVFSRQLLDEQDSAWLQMFANQGAVSITNAQTFDDLARAEATLRENAQQLRQLVDVVPHHLVLFETDLSSSFVNRAALEFFKFNGAGADKMIPPLDFLQQVTHPEDVEKLVGGMRQAVSSGKIFDTEIRMRRHDGQYRWFLYQLYPMRDEGGRIFRWCGIRTDIEERKQAEERVQRENLALREEIDKVSMFEEIVGTSEPLQAALARVAKVARTDSTVLITGETGTGKELIARAIHKRSPRSARAFVSVNCAVIPRDLVASELFGHEKGAFTGAMQRRLGRFELAEGGTIFLDEMGELPIETQVALLRVLQEKEFERIGGNHSIRADVRVIAATNRDLPAAIAAGIFRSDLFYRINVFPIEIPPLRERKEDIRLLVEYFIDRYSSKAGKKIQRIDKKSLDQLQSYPWPGNIRELQNVIERSVIVCDTEEFSVDESWLSHEPRRRRPLSDELVDRERESIEAALAKTGGQVAGPAGAAVKLGMPASTLDSKIRSLKIDKRRFQNPSHS
jgi:PAS domain S-box-containing protein